MKINFQGFSYSLGKKITQENFVDYLLECSEGDFTLRGRKRIFYCTSDGDPDYWTGVLITIKDHKAFPRLKDNKKIVVSETSPGESLMEFNYFVIHKKSFRGMYQYYHHSCNLNQFGIFLKIRFDNLKKNKIKKILETQNNANIEKQKDKLELEFGNFYLSIMVRKENLKKLLQELSVISSFDFDVHVIEADEKDFIPAPEFATRVHKHVVFDRKSALAKVSKGIRNFINNRDVVSGRIKGYDPAGLERTIEITNNPDFFGEYDFDAVARNIKNTDIDDLKNNWVIKELIRKAKANHFEVLVK